MLEHLRDRALRGIYASVFLLGIAMSIAFSVLAVYLRAAKIADETIGSLAAAFAAGGVLASFALGGVIRRFTAKRTLVVSLLGFACTIGVLPLLGSKAAIAASRFVEGACTVAMWLSTLEDFRQEVAPGESSLEQVLPGGHYWFWKDPVLLVDMFDAFLDSTTRRATALPPSVPRTSWQPRFEEHPTGRRGILPEK